MIRSPAAVYRARPLKLLPLLAAGVFVFAARLPAVILWSDLGARLTHSTGDGVDILGGVVKRDDSASDALYFKFHVDPLSDAAVEPYDAALQLFEHGDPRLAVGNAPEAWGYSAWYTSELGPSNKVAGEFNLKSSNPEPSRLGQFLPYELPHHNVERTIIFKVQYVPGGDDLVTVWLHPNLGRGATDKNQLESLVTKFKANASFDQIRLRHDNGGNGWTFSDMAVATAFDDFIVIRFWQTWWFISVAATGLLVGVGTTVRVVEKRKFQRRLQLAEQERALERERARIAQDLHDDLGSSLTQISLLSGLVRADKNNPREVEAHAIKLTQAADQTVRALEEIVWAVRPGSDTLQGLVEYIAHFASELFAGNPTRCRLDLPHDLPMLTVPPDMRHNIFLIVKEALTNTLKHAAAGEVRVQAKAEGSLLEILVEDDGHGYTPASRPVPEQRNGLGNMRQRAESIGGKLELQSAPGRGTTVRLTVNLAANHHKPGRS